MNSSEFNEMFLEEKELLQEDLFSLGTLSTIFATLWVRKEAQAAKTAMASFLEKQGHAEVAKKLMPVTKRQAAAKIFREFFERLGTRGSNLARAMFRSLLGRESTRKILQRVAPNLLRTLPALEFVPLSVGSITTAGAGNIAAGATIAAGVGALAGYLINTAIYSSFSEELQERIERAKANPNYAKAELDLYCGGRGALCKDEVECSGQPGGYVYETAGEGGGFFSRLGATPGEREKFGIIDRRYRQTPNSFHANDGVAMVAMLKILVAKDIKDGKIKLTGGKKAEVSPDAESLKYKNCVEKRLFASSVMTSKIKKAGLAGDYELLMLTLGFKEIPKLKKKDKAAPVGKEENICNSYPMTVGCKGQQPATTVAILVRTTESGKRAFKANEKKFEKIYADKVYTEEVKDFIEDTLRSITDKEIKELTANLQLIDPEFAEEINPSKIADEFKAKGGKITVNDSLDDFLFKLAKTNRLIEMLRSGKLQTLINEALEEEMLLLEGGAGGHMRHPFDLDDVKTGEDLIKKFEQIGSEIEGGNRPDTKIDGVNTSIKIVDTPEGKQFAMDRGSSKPIDVEGITVNRLPERFSAGHGMIPAGENVLGIFNDALKDAEPELKELGVLDDPTKFFNMEYVKGTTNVLAYDHDFLKIHGVNQFYEKKNRKGQPVRPGLERPIDPETKKTIKDPSVPVAYDQEVMDRLVEKLNKVADKYGFKVYSAIPSTSTGDFDFNPVMNVPVPVTYSTGDIREETLGERLKAAKNRIKEKVRTVDGRTPPAQGKEIYKAVLGASAADTNADPERQIPLDELLASDDDYQRAIDGAVFWHATRLLGNVIMNNMVVDHPAVSGPATEHEGLVIRLSGDGFDTKITGEFILGGEATSFRAAEPEAAKEVKAKNIAIFPGSFKPPHKGHLSIIERIAKNPEVDEIKVIISAPGKKVRSPKVTPEKAKAIFEKFISAANISKPVSVEIASQPSPIGAAYEYIGEKAGPNENIMLLTSEADAKRYPQAVLDKAVASNKNADTVTARGFVLPVCRDEGCDTTAKVSATTIRNIVDAYPEITLQDLTRAIDHMPETMSTADKLAAFEMLVDDSLSNKFEDEELNTLNESVRFIMETIDKALDVVLLTEKVRKTKGKQEYCVVSKNKKTKEGKLRTYGCYRSRKAANKRLGQVEGFKARAMAEGEEVEEYEIVEASVSSGMAMGYAGPFKGLIREED